MLGVGACNLVLEISFCPAVLDLLIYGKEKNMLKILCVFINKCKAASRYGEDNCLFNAKCLFGVLFSLNLLTIFFFLFKREQLVNLIPSDKKTYMLVALFFVALFFLLFTVVYPKRKILAVQLDVLVQKKIFIGTIIYIVLSGILFSISLYVSR